MFEAGIKKGKVFDCSTSIGVFSFELLQKEEQYQQYFDKVKALVGTDPTRYDTCYEPLIKEYCEFMQLIPLSSQGLLGEGLRKGLLTGLEYLTSFVEEEGENATDIERFALYSYALCQYLGYVVVNYQVVITNKEGDCLSFWDPYQGSLVLQKAAYYRLLPPRVVMYQSAIGQVTVLLARQILPEAAFDWMTLPENQQIFIEWILLLSGDTSGGLGRLSHIITRYGQDIEEILIEELLLWEDIELIENEDLKIAAEFLDWLEQKIEHGELNVNSIDAGLHITHTGLLVESWLFKDFVMRTRADLFAVVFQRLAKLFGLPELHGVNARIKQYGAHARGGRMSTFRSTGPGEERSGVILPVALSAKGQSAHVQSQNRASLQEIVRHELAQVKTHTLR